MSEQTLFQKIFEGEIPSKIEYEDDLCMAIRDINPQAPVHCLIIPKKVISRIAEAHREDQALLGHLLLTAQRVAAQLKCDQGYRIVINNGVSAGETIPHLHVHLLGQRVMDWPPG